MKSFEILGISTFSDIEKVDAAYEQKFQELSGNREIYPDSLFEKKVHELVVAKKECIAYLSSSATMRIKKQLSETYEYHMQQNVLHDCGCLLQFGGWLCLGFGFYGCQRLLCEAAYAMEREKPEERRKNQLQNEEEKKRKAQDRLKKQEADRKEREQKRFIAKKTKEISKQSRFLDADIIKWEKLQRRTPCTLQDLKVCDKLVALLESADTNSDDIHMIRKNLTPHRKAAEEKQEIMTRALTVAQLYRDIGNPEAAEGLLKKYNPEKR